MHCRRAYLQGAPVLIWPVERPTARSAMDVSSVSPDRWLVMTPQPLAWKNTANDNKRREAMEE